MSDAVLQRPQIKVCGLTNPDDARCAKEAGAQMLGFVVADWSPRGVLPSRVAEILKSLTDPPTTVLVTVGEEARRLEEMAREAGVDYVQLCGDERPEEYAGFPFPILRRIGVCEEALSEIKEWSSVASAFVLDHPSAPGGTGKTVDLSLARELAAHYPCILAGGLSSANVAEAASQVRPLGVDASSKLELKPGHKNPDEVYRFVTLAREALEARP